MPKRHKPGPRPDMSNEERARRNHRILALFIAGSSENEIGRMVDLTGVRVNQIIKQELKNAARHHQLLTDQALAIYVERLETLLKAVWPKVATSDLKAIEVARRLLEQQARLYDIEEERMPALPPMSEQDMVDEDNPAMDDLSRYRMRHRRKAEGEAGGL